MTKTGYNKQYSKSYLRLHNFREVQLCKKQLKQQIDSKMEKIPKMSRVLRGNCCETCRNIPQKEPMKKFYQQEFFSKACFSGTSAASSYK